MMQPGSLWAKLDKHFDEDGDFCNESLPAPNLEKKGEVMSAATKKKPNKRSWRITADKEAALKHYGQFAVLSEIELYAKRA